MEFSSQPKTPSRYGKDGQERTGDVVTVTPLSVKMLLSAKKDDPKSPYQIDGVDMHTVVIVGLILEVVPSQKSVNYKIDDGSECVDVVQWTLGAEQNSELKDGVYVRVAGQIKEGNEGKELNAFQIEIIKDFNEITSHHLAVITAHLSRVKGPLPISHDQLQNPGSQTLSPPISPSILAGGRTMSSGTGGQSFSTTAHAAEAEYSFGGIVETGRFARCLNDCIKAFQALDLPGGSTRDDILLYLKGNYTDLEVGNAITRLYDDGKICIGNTEEHFRIA
ncbi:Replication protein A 32 kDa subunit [Monocercomonoides exilis]|uniref:Replication protein A 32 kDa subunit n=1 Tax=Monocercomonoides exilis TaxID=2049356 RepID=UPI003559AA0E|nr:Replication protein A 32 kDa subunit [Monocercomonoides exilis]|eukprot:MONOS_5093.1-p1 / transcript=MONOS_5093.1 / gene=MONOS_5093 / organism=Monocercomonoides_exilis_PA203 / gene_product=Replication protein A 32 kDa subunit / transcript_product=Replication protein A 32 kDa subunit / location=Mono_scaffold00144:77716-78907(+) / protein_length=278 / sequence_SO=supercontig / SO=protein_coding / is_pseudo=false